MTETVMSSVLVDGELRITCNGCTELLECVGLVVRAWSRPLNPRQPEFMHTHFTIAPGATLADCQGVVRDRHIGNHGEMWGEL